VGVDEIIVVSMATLARRSPGKERSNGRPIAVPVAENQLPNGVVFVKSEAPTRNILRNPDRIHGKVTGRL
jgi:hypothetical protein